MSEIGDYDNQEQDDDEVHSDENNTLIDTLRALSIGCKEEEAWKS